MLIADCTCDECEGRGRFADGFYVEPLVFHAEEAGPLDGAGL